MKQVKESLEEEIKALREFNAELDSKYPELLMKKRGNKKLNLKRIFYFIVCIVLLILCSLSLGADLVLENGPEIIIDCISIIAIASLTYTFLDTTNNNYIIINTNNYDRSKKTKETSKKD